MTKKTKKRLGFGCLGLLGLVGILLVVAPGVYRKLDESYQREMDVVRKRHAEEIAGLIREYEEEAGKLPFQEEAGDGNFMALLGHSQKAEDAFATEDVLKRDALFVNGETLEAELSKVLGRTVSLPRDPQKVATYAPNVYVYFLSGEQFSVAVHLYQPSTQSVPYQWRNGTFHSHTLTYRRQVK